MLLDFRNINTLWCSVLVETLVRLGLKEAVICPGSRSTPLTIAFVNHPQIKTIPVLDERSAAFFALGKAKQSSLPVVLVCSSGTAGANFYPAVIEASETHVPLIILTADRPPELRHCHAGQTIDQIKLYGSYPNWYAEFALPKASLYMLAYLRQNIVQAWKKSLYPHRGIVHLNCPFREPLAPIVQPEIEAKRDSLVEASFFAHLKPFQNSPSTESVIKSSLELNPIGIIVAGLTQTPYPEKYCREIALLSRKLQFPVLAEALSPLRNYASLNPYLITTYDAILREPAKAAKLQPQTIVQIGELPTSKKLRNWLDRLSATRYVLTQDGENFDPLHGRTIHLQTSLRAFSETVSLQNSDLANEYLQTWCTFESETRKAISLKLEPLEDLYEGKVAWLISQHLPPQTPIFLANSMSVRNAEFFWQPNDTHTVPHFNRGANGIDGTLSTALGIADSSDLPTVMLTGDLALLHDTNGFLINNHFSGHLTIILINNNGGGIFELLPIARFDPPFEKYFATPQNIDFASLSQTYGVEYHLIKNWQQLPPLLDPLPDKGIRLLEIKTNRKQDANWLKNNLGQL